jgi:predicted transcriptional regulator
MKKTSIYLDDADVERLRRLAEREGRSQAEIVRAAIALYDEQKPDRNFLLAGAWESDGRSVADIPEEELLRGFGEDSLPEDMRSDPHC